MTEMQASKYEDNLRPLIYLLVLIFIIWLMSYLAICLIVDKVDRGTFGDTFGMVNSLFSGFAFAGIIYTILLQRKELQLQRLELSQTREELKRSADAQEKSELALKEQIKAMSTTAKLNGLNTLFEYYSEREIRLKLSTEGGQEARKIKEMYLNEIANLIRDIKN